MSAKTFTPQEIKQRQALSITRIRDVVTRDWTDKSRLIRKIEVGYDCTVEQAQAIFTIGIMNGYIEHDQEFDVYRVTEGYPND